MSVVNGKQPSIRFNVAGPYAMAGVSYVPKILTFQKSVISGTENEDFVTLPAGTFISQAFMQVDSAVNNSGVVTLGTDGNADALIDATDFDASTDGNWATNIGSTTAAAARGLFLAAEDTLRLASTGTATEGSVSGFIVYFETAAMNADGIHFEL